MLLRHSVPSQDVGAPVDVVADVVGGTGFPDLIDALAEGGRLVTAGAIAGPQIEIDVRRLYLHSRRLIGSAMWTPTHFQQLVHDARNGTFTPVIAKAFPLKELASAQEEFGRKQFVGKLVLDVPAPTGG